MLNYIEGTSIYRNKNRGLFCKYEDSHFDILSLLSDVGFDVMFCLASLIIEMAF